MTTRLERRKVSAVTQLFQDIDAQKSNGMGDVGHQLGPSKKGRIDQLHDFRGDGDILFDDEANLGHRDIGIVERAHQGGGGPRHAGQLPDCANYPAYRLILKGAGDAAGTLNGFHQDRRIARFLEELVGDRDGPDGGLPIAVSRKNDPHGGGKSVANTLEKLGASMPGMRMSVTTTSKVQDSIMRRACSPPPANIISQRVALWPEHWAEALEHGCFIIDK